MPGARALWNGRNKFSETGKAEGIFFQPFLRYSNGTPEKRSISERLK